MIRVELEKVVRQPIEQVFDRLVDISSYSDWMPGNGLFIDCGTETDEPVRQGTTYWDRTRLGTVHGEVIVFERPVQVVFHYTARYGRVPVMEGWPGYRLKRVNASVTCVRHLARGTLKGPFRLFRPLVQYIAQKERSRTLQALKQSLETTAQVPTGYN